MQRLGLLVAALVPLACTAAPRAPGRAEPAIVRAAAPTADLRPAPPRRGEEVAPPLSPPPAPPPDAHDPIRVAAVGDLMLARTIGARLELGRTPFGAVAERLRGADVALGNLECAIGAAGSPAKKAFTFRAPALAVHALLDAGLDVVSVANNHALDFGVEGMNETLALLDRAGIAHAGAGATEDLAHRAATLTIRGHTLAFLSYVKVMVEGNGGFDTGSWVARGDTPGVAWADPARIATDVARAKEHADHVIVMLHSGFESHQAPNIWQISASEAAIDAGATLVVGAHPHVLQGARRYKRGFIAYSLGNFVFDRTDVVSAVLEVTLDDTGVKDVGWFPVLLRDGYPIPADERTGTYVKNLIKGLSMPLGG